MTSNVLEKIGKLLIQAERTGNEAEQDTFFKKAQSLASQYSVELEIARQSVTNKELREQPTQKHITIGEPRKPLNATFCELFMSIGRPQGLKFNISHKSLYVVAFGFPSDIAIAEAIYAHVSVQMVQMADEFIKGGSWKGDTTYDYRTGEYKPVHSRVARRCFYEAFIARVGRRLSEAKREVEHNVADQQVTVTKQATREEPSHTESMSTALVLKGKEVEVSDFYKRTSNARGSWRGGSGNTYTSNTGSSAGRNAGDRARLGGQGAITGGKRGISRG